MVACVEQVLVVSSSEKGRTFLTQLLKSAAIAQTVTAQSGSEARRMLAQSDFALVVVNAPLSDEYGHELCTQIADTSPAGILLLAKSEIADDISARLEPYGVFVLAKPLSKTLFFQALRLAQASRRRMLGLQRENVKLQAKIEEIRLCDRAKCALIQYLSMTEAQAHRYIEKQAMDLRLSRREIAENILKTYEN